MCVNKRTWSSRLFILGYSKCTCKKKCRRGDKMSWNSACVLQFEELCTIQNFMMVAFLYVLSIYAKQNQHYTMHIMLSVHVSFKVQSRDIIIRHFVTSPFKTVHFQIFCKNYYDEVNVCIFFINFTRMKSN